MEASSKKLQDKLSMLHATKMTEKLIGINLLSVSADNTKKIYGLGSLMGCV